MWAALAGWSYMGVRAGEAFKECVNAASWSLSGRTGGMKEPARFSSASGGLNWVTGLQLPTSGRGLDQDGPPRLSLTTAVPLLSHPSSGSDHKVRTSLATEPQSQMQVRSDTFATKTLQQKIHGRESCRTRVLERRRAAGYENPNRETEEKLIKT